MYGFVYIWYDQKHKRFYIGSHKGSLDDGYICSSSWMNSAYKRRPNDFKRKILSYAFSKNELYSEEQRFLNMIPDVELGKRYYNLKKSAWGGFHENAWKISAEKRSGHPISETHKQNISEALKGKSWSKIRRNAHTGRYIQKTNILYEHNGQLIGNAKEAAEYAGKCISTINRWCDPSSKWYKSDWKKYYERELDK